MSARPVPCGSKRAVSAALGVVVALLPLMAIAQPPTGWVRIDYGPLVDREAWTQSGETVGALLEELGGRSLPPAGERPRDYAIHRLLEPVLEPYAFLLSDVTDTREPPGSEPWVEIASLWERGETQPAWVDLLRTRRFVIESDGGGRIRAFVPFTARSSAEESETAAEKAWLEAWPVIRHPLAAERRRLAGQGSGEVPPLRVEVRAYRHIPEVSRFELGLEPYRLQVDDTRPDSRRAPLDMEALARVLASPVRLEGGRLESNGTIRWFTSEAKAEPTLLGEPMDLSDAAVAYRAIFHGGLAEPYMSLDKGEAPWTASVGFGGRLRDTRLGMVSLLSDIRFKTFSVGVDPLRESDLRNEIRARIGSFRTHLERFASDPASAEVGGQQTRFWFYPDHVEFALSPQGDVFAVRRARMSAASERVRLGDKLEAAGEDPPWTRELVSFLNDEYETLSVLFPELADLDRVVRLLSAFAWLKAAGEAGHLLPDLDVLLAVELPAVPSPRAFPQLLTRDILPPAGAVGPVEVLNQSWIGAALDRLRPRSGRFSPARRLERAIGLLDPRDPEQADAASRIGQAARDAAGDAATLALLADRASRVAMHRRALAFAPPPDGPARVFSVGIGGIDLGTSAVFARAARLSGGLGRVERAGPGTLDPPAAGGKVASDPGLRREDPPGVPHVETPEHGLADAREEKKDTNRSSWVRETERHRFARGVWPTGSEGSVSWTETRMGVDGIDVRVRRRIQDPEGRPAVFVRIEDGRFLSYRLVRTAAAYRPEVAWPQIPGTAFADDPAPSGEAEIPEGVVLLDFLPRTGAGGAVAVGPGVEPDEQAVVAVRRREAGGGVVAADLPRALLRRLVLGTRLDPPGTPPVPLFGSPDALMGNARAVLVMQREELARPPWEGPTEPIPGEEDAARIVEALGALWSTRDDARGRGAAVGVDPALSPTRWAEAPRLEGRIPLVIPPDAFPPGFHFLEEALRASWPDGDIREDVASDGPIVVLASAEAPGLLASRLRRLARSSAMKGRLLAVCALGGPLRPDLPAGLLAEGNLAGIAVVEPSAADGRKTAREMGDWALRVGSADRPLRAETSKGPFVWFY